MTVGPFDSDDDEYADEPFGNPRRAANIRWESTSKSLVRRVVEGAGRGLILVARIPKAVGRGFYEVGDATYGVGHDLWETGREWRRGGDD